MPSEKETKAHRLIKVKTNKGAERKSDHFVRPKLLISQSDVSLFQTLESLTSTVSLIMIRTIHQLSMSSVSSLNQCILCECGN